MDSEQGKIFIGGISFQTTEERLKDYFSMFGEVREAVIKKDRITGLLRGFGFIAFADPAVADRVLLESRHNIDGRMVEVKKFISSNEQNNITRSRSNTVSNGGHSQSSTKKIFVGGLPPTATEIDLVKYFEQFGKITNVTVMYDHITQKSRGFGFIVFESEKVVDILVQKPFHHQLNGKAIEVKRSIPREQARGGNSGASNGLGFNSNLLPPVNTNYSVPMGGTGGYSSYGPTGYNAPRYGTDAGYGPPISGGGYGNAAIGNNTPSYGISSYREAPIRYGGHVAYGAGDGGYGNNVAPDASSNRLGAPSMSYGNTGCFVEYGGPGSGSGSGSYYGAGGALGPVQFDNGQPNGSSLVYPSDYGITEFDYSSNGSES